MSDSTVYDRALAAVVCNLQIRDEMLKASATLPEDSDEAARLRRMLAEHKTRIEKLCRKLARVEQGGS